MLNNLMALSANLLNTASNQYASTLPIGEVAIYAVLGYLVGFGGDVQGFGVGQGVNVRFIRIHVGLRCQERGLDIIQGGVIGRLAGLLKPCLRFVVEVVAALGLHVLANEHLLHRIGQGQVLQIGDGGLVRQINAGSLIIGQIGGLDGVILAVEEDVAVDGGDRLVGGGFGEGDAETEQQRQQGGQETLHNRYTSL